MKNKSLAFWDQDWTILKFPKHNRSIIYNATTKKFQFYDLSSNTKKPSNPVTPRKSIFNSESTIWYYLCVVLALGFGTSLALLLTVLLT